MFTAEQVKEAVTNNNIKIVTIRQCTLCCYPLAYMFHNDTVYFDSGCDCVSYYSPPKERSWGELARYLNNFPDYTELHAKFGL